MSLFAPACIVADAPQYVTPGQRPPVLDLYNASPSTLKILDVSKNDTVLFNVPVRSEDAGEQLVALLFVDYGTGTSGAPQFSPVPASTYDDLTRAVAMPFSLPGSLSAGCHRLTLFVGHQSAFDFSSSPIKIVRKDDVALATWLINANPTPGAPVDIGACEEAAP